MRFRTKALAKRRQADQLDRLPEVARPRGWLAALALAIVVLGLIVYAIVGEIPRHVEAPGVLGSAGGVAEVQSNAPGTVEQVLVEPGERVKPDTAVLRLRNRFGEGLEVDAGYAGQVLDVRTAAGRVLTAGDDIVSIAREPVAPLTGADLFVPQQDAAGVAPGMEVDLNVAAAPSEAFGSLEGKVAEVGSAPISPQELDVRVSNDALVEQFSDQGPPVLVTVSLTEGGGPTGLAFTGGEGPDYPLSPGAVVTANIQQGGQSVIDVLLGGG